MSASDPLAHIPHLPAHPIFGHTRDALKDYMALVGGSATAFGEVFRVKLLGKWRIHFTSPEAAEFILTDPEKIFSSERGWKDTLSQLFPGALALRDHDDHRQHRRIMQAAFRKPALDSYLAMMAPELDRLVEEWPIGETFQFHRAIKDMTLKIGANVFMGLSSEDPATARMNADFRNQLAAAMTVIRKPLPFTPYRKGIKSRAALMDQFSGLVKDRRAEEGQDFFSRMCHARDEDGTSWSDTEIIEHFNFLMLAAHDTTASALSTMIWAMTEYPEWQDRLRAEVDGLEPGPMTPQMAISMTETEMVFHEAMRLVPPVPIIPRVATRDFDWNGTHIPAGFTTTVNVTMVMRSAAHFPDPDRFDPERFSPARAEHQSHRYAWVPFGGGVHKCIGLHFATLQVKAFLRALLTRYRVERTNDGEVTWQRVPTARPACGLPVRLIARGPLDRG